MLYDITILKSSLRKKQTVEMKYTYNSNCFTVLEKHFKIIKKIENNVFNFKK